MKSSHLFIVLLFVVSAFSFQELNSEYEIMSYFQKNSLVPVIHVYYNRHFKNSNKFEKFEDLLHQIHDDHSDYLDILFTDCEKQKQKKLQACERMRRTKDNRQITGTFPASQFRRFGNLLIQNPPSAQSLSKHQHDEYEYSDFYDLINPLLPNFYKQLNNLQQYEDFLLPRYSPKLILFIEDQDIVPTVMKKIAVSQFLKLDFAIITDLTQDLISKFTVKSFPSFAIMKYNFNQSQHEYFYYNGDLQQQNYNQIKQFVLQFALVQPRNDLLFHKIFMETNSQIVTIETQGQLEEYKQKASGWVIISYGDGQVSPKLFDYHQKYGRYFSYVNYVHQPHGKVQLYNPTQKIVFPLQTNDLQFNSLSFEDFKSNLTVWLAKDTVVIGVTTDYPHICGLAEKTMFRNHVRCLIIEKQGQEQLKDLIKIDFKIGFMARADNSKKGRRSINSGTTQTKGMKIQKDNFEQLYFDLDSSIRHKIRNDLSNYLQNPISQINYESKLEQICFHPFKKCLFLVTNLGKKDRTIQQYLKQVAFDYLNNYIIYEVDSSTNPEFVKAVGIKDQKADLIVYNFREKEYTRLNKKITKNLISQFLKANLKNDKRLKKEKSEQLGSIIIKRVGNYVQENEQLESEEDL